MHLASPENVDTGSDKPMSNSPAIAPAHVLPPHRLGGIRHRKLAAVLAKNSMRGNASGGCSPDARFLFKEDGSHMCPHQPNSASRVPAARGILEVLMRSTGPVGSCSSSDSRVTILANSGYIATAPQCQEISLCSVERPGQEGDGNQQCSFPTTEHILAHEAAEDMVISPPSSADFHTSVSSQTARAQGTE